MKVKMLLRERVQGKGGTKKKPQAKKLEGMGGEEYRKLIKKENGLQVFHQRTKEIQYFPFC